MKRNIRVGLTILYLLGGTVSAHDEVSLRSISVSGTVETKTAPDQIVWRITLTDTDKDMRKAKARNDAKIESVIALREKLDVGDEDIATGSVNIRREYERDQHGDRGDFKHFLISRSVTIRQRDLKRFDEFLDALVSSAEMDVGFSFDSSRIHEIRAETRLKALRAAKDKAEALVQVVGSKLGRVLTIDEYAQGRRWQSPASNMMVVQSRPSVDLASEKFVPGAMSVQVTVYATFEIL
ncbi:MAG: SIMPL domain-containing protein [Candidatus Hydrogenedentes bacterium]|nr:SIMPL domain-containing protein [Candidatus Hydrogenedentota bacterium]